VNDRLLRADVLIAAGIALVVLIVTPGLVVAAVVGLVALALLALIAAVERRRSRARLRSRQARRRGPTPRRVR
jgi:O-antigen/teichoic acid export membrane protein